MSTKSIVIKIVIGISIVALLSALIVFLSMPEKEAEVKDLKVLTRDESKIEKIEVISEGGFTLNLTDGKWAMEGMEEIGVNAAYASSLAKSLSNISSPMPAEENASDVSLYGLDNPKKTVHLTYSDGEETVKIGNDSGEFCYVITEGSDDVYIVAKKELYMVFLDKMEYLDTTAFEIDESLIDYVSYNDVVLTKVNEEWQEEKPYNRLTDSNKVKTDVITPISSIKAIEIVKKDGINLVDGGPVLVKANGEEHSFNVYRGENGTNYIEFDNSDYLYLVPDNAISFMNVTGFDLLVKYVAPVSISEVSKIEFISPSKTVVLSVEAPSTQAPVFYKDGKEVKEESFRNFYQILMGMTFNSEVSAQGKSEYSIIFTKENGEKIDIGFVSANDSEYAVVIDKKAQFAILKKSVTDVFDSLKDIEYVK